MEILKENSIGNFGLKSVLIAMKEKAFGTFLLSVPKIYIDIVAEIARLVNEEAQIKMRVIYNSYSAINCVNREAFLFNVNKSPKWMRPMLLALYRGSDKDTIYKMVIEYMLKEL